MKLIASSPSTLLEALSALSPDSSKNTLRLWIEKGRVCVNGQIVKHAKHLLEPADEVVVNKKTCLIENGIEILYEDLHLAVIHKPAGLLSVATDFDKTKTAHASLKIRRQGKIVYPVHRLDRETSGVMVFTYTTLSRDSLKEQFYEHTIEREYDAIVEGVISEKAGTWESYLAEDDFYVVASTENERAGKRAVTHYQTIDCTKRMSALRLRLETGRKNQIRVHCKEAGHPIVGDKKYGASLDSFGRLCLHAHKLGFIHPRSLKPMSFAVPKPFSLN